MGKDTGSGKDAKTDINDLLEQAKKLQNRIKQPAKEYVQKNDTVGIVKSIAEDLSFFRRTIVNIKETGLGIYERFIKPVWDFIGPCFNWIFRIYARIWNRYAYVVNKETGEKIVSRKRSSLLIGMTILFVAAFTPTWLGSAVRFVSVEPVMDGILMLVSKRTETFYLNNSEEIDPEKNIHSVRGCKMEGLCSEKDAAYFRIMPRLSHDIWKLIEYGNPIYVPDHVVAPIAPGVNRCEVTYYGYRMTSSWISRMLRSFELYPTMLETSCTHLDSGVNTVNKS